MEKDHTGTSGDFVEIMVISLRPWRTRFDSPNSNPELVESLNEHVPGYAGEWWMAHVEILKTYSADFLSVSCFGWEHQLHANVMQNEMQAKQSY